MLIIRFLVNFYRNLKFYFKNISIHGLCSFFRSSFWLEKIFWMIIFLFGVQYFFGLLYENFILFNNQPVQKFIDDTAYPTSSVPFPAVSVCNFNVVYKSYSEIIEKKLIEKGIKEDVVKRFFKHISALKFPIPISINPYKEVYKILREIGYTDDNLLMQDVSQKCDRLLKSCVWDEADMNCSEVFAPSKTDFGFCCSFNSELTPVDKTKNYEYFTSAGPFHGLSLNFNIDVDEYVSSFYNVTGVLVLVHDKNTFPSLDTVFYTVVEPGKFIGMKILPEVYEAERKLKKLTESIRKCWFNEEGERFLNMSYTFPNCMHICASDAIINYCNCVPYFLSNSKLVHVRTCNLLDMPCLFQNFANYSALHLKLNMQENSDNETICNCLPECSGITYAGYIESLNIKNKNGEILNNISGVRIYFQNNFCFKYIISPSVTPDSFIALVGGLFALCLGGSILSIYELVFYFLKSLLTNSKTQYPQLYWSEINALQIKSSDNRKKIKLNAYFNH